MGLSLVASALGYPLWPLPAPLAPPSPLLGVVCRHLLTHPPAAALCVLLILPYPALSPSPSWIVLPPAPLPPLSPLLGRIVYPACHAVWILWHIRSLPPPPCSPPTYPSPPYSLVTPWSCIYSPLTHCLLYPCVDPLIPVCRTHVLHCDRAWHWRSRRRPSLAYFGVPRIRSLPLPHIPVRLDALLTMVFCTRGLRHARARIQRPPRWLGSFCLLPDLSRLHLAIRRPWGTLSRFRPPRVIGPGTGGAGGVHRWHTLVFPVSALCRCPIYLVAWMRC